MRRKRRTERHGNHERWLISYADFITLLFAFFTTMYAISNVDAQKLGRLVVSMQAAFDPAISPASARTDGLGPIDLLQGSAPVPLSARTSIAPEETPPAGKPPSKARSLEPLRVIEERLEAVLAQDRLGEKVKFILDRRGLIIRLAEVGFYESGSSTMRAESMAVIDRLAGFLATLEHAVRIEGHTDNVPIKTSRYPSNWELSTARATHLIVYLVERHELDPNRLSASGYGEFRPLMPNNTAEHRAMNRRIDIIILSEESAEQEPSRDTPG